MLSLLCLPFAFWACGDDSSSPVRDTSSSVPSDTSRVIPSDVEGSSSSVASSNSAKSSSSINSSDSGWSWDVPKEARLNPEIEYGEMTDDRDGQTYKTVEICNEYKSLCQTWMAQNLNYADSVNTISLKGKSWCYKDEDENCEVTGRLYTWVAAIDSAALANDTENPQTCGYGKTCDRLKDDELAKAPIQGVCPSGWHLPSYEEWQTLFTAVGGISNAGKALKSGFGWYSYGYGTDAYGFSALPAGYWGYDGHFDLAGYNAFFWSASQHENFSYNAYIMDLYYYFVDADLYYGDKSFGYSVRCIKD